MTTPADANKLIDDAFAAKVALEVARQRAHELLTPDPVEVLADVIADRDMCLERCNALTAYLDEIHGMVGRPAVPVVEAVRRYCNDEHETKNTLRSARDAASNWIGKIAVALGLSEFAPAVAVRDRAKCLRDEVARLTAERDQLKARLKAAEADATTQRTAADNLRAALDRVAKAAGVESDSTATVVADLVIAIVAQLTAWLDAPRLAARDGRWPVTAPADLDAVRAALGLVALATPGPWVVGDGVDAARWVILAFNGMPIASLEMPNANGGVQQDANAAAIVAIINAAPAIAAAVEELTAARAEIAALNRQVCRLVSGQEIEGDRLCQHHGADVAALAQIARYQVAAVAVATEIGGSLGPVDDDPEERAAAFVRFAESLAGRVRERVEALEADLVRALHRERRAGSDLGEGLLSPEIIDMSCPFEGCGGQVEGGEFVDGSTSLCTRCGVEVVCTEVVDGTFRWETEEDDDDEA